jgi:pimeloyl-ACP methyl ester carboxylesterase
MTDSSADQPPLPPPPPLRTQPPPPPKPPIDVFLIAVRDAFVRLVRRAWGALRRIRPGWATIPPLLILGVAIVALVIAGQRLDDASGQEASARTRLQSERDQLDDAQSQRRFAHDTATEVGDAGAALGVTATELRALHQELVDIATAQRDALLAEDADGFNALLTRGQDSAADIEAIVDDLTASLDSYDEALRELPTAACPGEARRRLHWVDYGGGLECAVLVVPLDHDKPRGEKIEITVTRRPADDPAAAVGPLFVNPGGPGVSGIDMVRHADLSLPDAVLRQFDLIGFDPRGVGVSTPVDCADDLDSFFAVDQSPVSVDQWGVLEDAATDLAQRCAERSGPLLAHIGTRDVARDMERIRVALDVPAINYLGYSYGSLLGAVYADEYPDRVRAFVLDGAVLPPLKDEPAIFQALGLDAALEAALDDCAARSSCLFYGGEDPRQEFNRLRASFAHEPLEGASIPVNRTVADLAVLSTLYSGRSGWRELIDALVRADEGHGRPLAELFGDYVGRRSDGTYDNSYEALIAVNCLEDTARTPVSELNDLADDLEYEAPVFSAFSAAGAAMCTNWPVEPSRVEQPTAAGADPILVIGNTGDPVTPYPVAQAMAEQLESARLLTYDGDGHTIFGRSDACIDLNVVAYLVDLELPAEGTTCP